MKFGYLEEGLTDVDFTLPPDGELTASVLASSERTTPFEVKIGATKWNANEWIGQIYPHKAQEDEFLKYYVKQLSTVELNTLFYGAPSDSVLTKWKDVAKNNPDFQFCPKFSQSISHVKRLKDAGEATSSFYNTAHMLGDNLGPMFLQLPDKFSPKHFPTLEAYLQHLPKSPQVFLEVRHPDWFANKEISKELFELLHSLNIGAVISDAAGRRDCLHMTLPIPHAFVRFVGNGHETDSKRLDDWVARIKQWRDDGLKRLHFFMHQHNERITPLAIDYLTQRLNEELSLSLRRPYFVSE